jgi:hypothetical protein
MKRLFVAFIIFFIFSCAEVDEVSPAKISFFIGDVSVNSEKPAIGSIVSSGDVVKTGSRSSIDIVIGSSLLRIKESSEVVITQAIIDEGNEKTELSVESGSILCKPKKLLRDESFTVKTASAVCAVRGTEFSVRTDSNKTSLIKVYEGNVKVAPRVTQLENDSEKLNQFASTINERQAAVVSLDDAQKAQDAVSNSLSSGKTTDQALRDNADLIKLKDERIKQFDASDFSRELEIIQLEEPEPEPEPVPVPVRRVIIPVKLVVSRYEVYKVRGGNIIERAAVVSTPITLNNNIYAASSNKVYAADSNGKILWEKSVNGISGISIDESTVLVDTENGTIRLSVGSGNNL